MIWVKRVVWVTKNGDRQALFPRSWRVESLSCLGATATLHCTEPMKSQELAARRRLQHNRIHLGEEAAEGLPIATALRVSNQTIENRMELRRSKFETELQVRPD